MNRQLDSVEESSPTLITVFSPDLSPKNRYLATLDSNAGATLWYWGSEQLSAAVCKHLNANLSRGEWQHYLRHEPYSRTCPNLPEGTNSSQSLFLPPTSGARGLAASTASAGRHGAVRNHP